MLRRWFGILVVGSLLGCGSNVPPSVPVTPAAPPALKAMLEDLAKSGELGSGAESIEQAVNDFAATDAAKGEALKKDFAELKVAKDAAKIKAKAKEMAGKL